MKRTICPYCGEEMLDDDRSTRFRCQYCGKLFDGWKEELHETLKEAIPTRMEENGVKVEKHPAPYGYPFNLGYCPVCLCQLDEGDLFCRQCGAKLIWD